MTASCLIEGRDPGRLWDNRSEAARSCRSTRPLTHLIDLTDRQDEMKATNPALSVHACAIADCERSGRLKRGWCSMHYSRWRKFGDPAALDASRELTDADALHRLVVDAQPGEQPCIVGCAEPGRPQLCTRCLHRFWSKVAMSEDGCWHWTGTIITSGYGMFAIRSQNRPAHRISYEHLIGPIPEGLVLDHLCRVRKCVNPQHLDPVTHQINVARGVGLAAVTRRSGVCQRGHEIAGNNVYVAPGDPSRRRCKACRDTRGSRVA